MFKKEINYEDYFGNKREEVLYFNLTKTELTLMEVKTDGGLANVLENILETQDQPKIFAWFERIVEHSYGVKSEDGKRFMKGEDIVKEFKESPAFDLFMQWLFEDTQNAVNFVNGILPDDIGGEKTKHAPKTVN